MRRGSWMIVGLLLVVACNDTDPPLEKRTLPGFSIGVPGEVNTSFTTEYDYGWANHEHRGRHLWTSVLWREGALDVDVATADKAEEWLATFNYEDPLTISENDIAFQWKHLETRSYKLFIGLERTDLTFVACGGRLIAVHTSHQSRRDASRSHRRTVASIECTPVAEEEPFLSKPPPVKTTVPAGWEAVTDVDPLWAVWTNRNATLMFMFFHRGHESLEDVKQMVVDAIGHWGTVEATGSEKVGEIELWRGTLTDDEGAQTVLAHKVMCGARPMLAVLFGYETIEEGRAALLAARCE